MCHGFYLCAMSSREGQLFVLLILVEWLTVNVYIFFHNTIISQNKKLPAMRGSSNQYMFCHYNGVRINIVLYVDQTYIVFWYPMSYAERNTIDIGRTRTALQTPYGQSNQHDQVICPFVCTFNLQCSYIVQILCSFDYPFISYP